MRGELVTRAHAFIPRRCCYGQSIIKDIVAGEPRTQRLHQRLGVDERISDALCGDRIPVIAGVADEHPSLAIWLAQMARYSARPVPLLLATALARAGKEIWRRFERPPDVTVNI